MKRVTSNPSLGSSRFTQAGPIEVKGIEILDEFRIALLKTLRNPRLSCDTLAGFYEKLELILHGAWRMLKKAEPDIRGVLASEPGPMETGELKVGAKLAKDAAAQACRRARLELLAYYKKDSGKQMGLAAFEEALGWERARLLKEELDGTPEVEPDPRVLAIRCKAGHERNRENTVYTKDGRIRCLACERNRNARRREKKRKALQEEGEQLQEGRILRAPGQEGIREEGGLCD